MSRCISDNNNGIWNLKRQPERMVMVKTLCKELQVVRVLFYYFTVILSAFNLWQLVSFKGHTYLYKPAAEELLGTPDVKELEVWVESNKSGHWRCSIKKAVFKNFAIFSGKNLCWRLFSIKWQVSGVRPATLLQRDSNTGEIWEIFKNIFFFRALLVAASGAKKRN